MADKSAIEWTDATWNPIRARNIKTGKVGWHCEHATTGCELCYSERTNKWIGTGLPFKPGHRKDVEIFLDETMLTQPLRWTKPRMIFPNSMTDLFADFVPDWMIDRIFAVMALTPQHTYQPLTKRADRMRDYFAARMDGDPWAEAADYLADLRGIEDHPAVLEPRDMPLPNVWLGVSTERQQEADERIPLLLQTPAAVRFISAEPLLGPIDLTRLCILPQKPGSIRAGIHLNALKGSYRESGVVYKGDWDITKPPPPDSERRKLDWVIVGGESGPNARPMHPDWARSLCDQCEAAGVPFFFKQWGEWLPWSQFTGASIDDDAEQSRFVTREWDGERCWRDVGRPQWSDTADGNIDDAQCVGRVGKAGAGRLLDGVEHNGFPTRGDGNGV